MKILFLVNKPETIDYAYQDDIDKAITYVHDKTPLKVQFDIEYTHIDFRHTVFKKFNDQFMMGSHDAKEQLRPLVEKDKYHLVCFMYDKSDSIFYNLDKFMITSWSFFNPLYPLTEYVEIAMDRVLDNQDWLWKSIAHEFMHAFVKRTNRRGLSINDEMDMTVVNGVETPYYKNHDPFAPDGNFARTLNNLSKHWDAVDYMPDRWKYFRPSEVRGLRTDLVDMLDQARGIAGIPFVITSGRRSKLANKLAGGVSDSAHLTGHAVDLRAKTSQDKYKIVTALLEVGFTRIGVASNFVHGDIHPDKPQGVIWTY